MSPHVPCVGGFHISKFRPRGDYDNKTKEWISVVMWGGKKGRSCGINVVRGALKNSEHKREWMFAYGRSSFGEGSYLRKLKTGPTLLNKFSVKTRLKTSWKSGSEHVELEVYGRNIVLGTGFSDLADHQNFLTPCPCHCIRISCCVGKGWVGKGWVGRVILLRAPLVILMQWSVNWH